MLLHGRFTLEWSCVTVHPEAAENLLTRLCMLTGAGQMGTNQVNPGMHLGQGVAAGAAATISPGLQAMHSSMHVVRDKSMSQLTTSLYVGCSRELMSPKERCKMCFNPHMSSALQLLTQLLACGEHMLHDRHTADMQFPAFTLVC